MIHFEFTLDPYDDDISPFELGDMKITNGQTEISSNQSMMIFLSISELLGKVRRVITHQSSQPIKYSSVDSAFELIFLRKNDNVTIQSGLNKIETTITEIKHQLYEQTVEFYKKYSDNLERKHSYYDLKKSLIDFGEMMKLN